MLLWYCWSLGVLLQVTLCIWAALENRKHSPTNTSHSGTALDSGSFGLLISETNVIISKLTLENCVIKFQEKNHKHGAGEMASSFKGTFYFTEDPSLVPNTHISWLLQLQGL